jgi:photosystem II stability/assembly factor-like uncharacterized protein
MMPTRWIAFRQTGGAASAIRWLFLILIAALTLTACGRPDTAGTLAEPNTNSGTAANQPIRQWGTAVRAMQLISATQGWVLTDKHFLVTNDGGGHWTDMKLPQSVPASTIENAFFLDAVHGWAVAAEAQQASLVLFTTSDGGKTWSTLRIAPLDTDDDVSSDNVSISFVDAQHGWVMVPLISSSNLSRGVLFQTTNGGTSWNKLSIPIGAPIRFTTPSEGWLAGGAAGDKLYATHDGGQTWQPEEVSPPTVDSTSQPTYDLPTFQNSQDGVLPVTFAGPKHSGISFYATHDGGQSWSLTTSVTSLTELDPGQRLPAKVIDTSHWAVTLPKGKLHTTTDSGKNWQATQTSSLPAGIVELNFVTSTVGWARTTVGTCAQFKTQCSTQTAVLTTSDGGATWKPLLSLTTPT